VIESEEYGLEEDFSRILRHDTEFGDESLFEISYSTEEGQTWEEGSFNWGNGCLRENNVHWVLCSPRGDGFFEGGVIPDCLPAGVWPRKSLAIWVTSQKMHYSRSRKAN